MDIMLNDVATFARITVDPEVCTGKPCIRNLRFPVSRLLGLLAAGQTREEILQAYPYLESADIDEAPTTAGPRSRRNSWAANDSERI